MATEVNQEQQRGQEPEVRDHATVTTEWKNIQKNAVCRWANERLKADGLEITDLESDLGDGLRLIRLAESLAGVKIRARYNAKPTTRTQKLENVTMCLQFLEREQKVRIINIDSSDIVDGNLKLILGLMWTLILHYSISLTSLTPPPGAAGADDVQPVKKPTKLSPKQQLLLWINQHISDRHVNNFTSDWKDGKTLAALVNSLDPDECSDWRSWDDHDAVSNTERAMSAASSSLNIAELITAEEMCDSSIDEFSVMTYLSQFPHAEPKQQVAVTSAEQQSTQEAKETRKDDDNDEHKAALILAYGDGLSAGYVGHHVKFTVTNKDRTRPAPVQVHIEGPSKVQLVHKETSEGFEFTYFVAIEGEYVVSVMYNDRLHIPGSPFRPKFQTIENSYKVTVYTGDVFGAGTDANVYIVFVGEIGESKIQLKSSQTHLNKFERGNFDVFFVEVYNIGELRHIRMGHDNAGVAGGAWFLDRVLVELPLWHRKWNFPHSRWISRTDDDKKLEHVLYSEVDGQVDDDSAPPPPQ